MQRWVNAAIAAREAACAIACIAVDSVDTRTTVVTRVRWTIVDVVCTRFTIESSARAIADERINVVDTDATVLASARFATIGNVDFAVIALESCARAIALIVAH